MKLVPGHSLRPRTQFQNHIFHKTSLNAEDSVACSGRQPATDAATAISAGYGAPLVELSPKCLPGTKDRLLHRGANGAANIVRH
jgi:hypothetical protein